MTSSLAQVSPPLLTGVAIFLTGSAAALVALHSAMLALAGPRTTLPPRTQVVLPVMAALLLGGWLGWAVVHTHALGLEGPLPGRSSPLAALPTLAAMLVAIGVGVSFLSSRTVRTFYAAMPPDWLIRIQVYRTAGASFLWPFMTDGMLPAAFALPAGIGDAITGLTAPFVAAAVAQGRPGAHRLAVAWNWFGIIDLIVAPTAAVLSGTQLASIHPLGLIPLFLGPPLGILTHIYSLRNLAANRAASPQ